MLLEDVTIPGGTRLSVDEEFTKTWQIKNTGTCHWSGSTINFLSETAWAHRLGTYLRE